MHAKRTTQATHKSSDLVAQALTAALAHCGLLALDQIDRARNTVSLPEARHPGPCQGAILCGKGGGKEDFSRGQAGHVLCVGGVRREALLQVVVVCLLRNLHAAR